MKDDYQLINYEDNKEEDIVLNTYDYNASKKKRYSNHNKPKNSVNSKIARHWSTLCLNIQKIENKVKNIEIGAMKTDRL